MNVEKVTLLDRRSQASAVVVIDVCRAFTTAAYAFAAGAEEIWLVRTTQEAFQLKEHNPELILMGEEDGLPIPGFDFWNSPSQIAACDFQKKTLVMRTSSGTQGAVLYSGADLLLAGSFVVADATAQRILRHHAADLALVTTGVRDGKGGFEDIALADYLQSLLLGENPDLEPYLQVKRMMDPASKFADPVVVERYSNDMEYCFQPNVFDFSMLIKKVGSQVVMTCERSVQA